MKLALILSGFLFGWISVIHANETIEPIMTDYRMDDVTKAGLGRGTDWRVPLRLSTLTKYEFISRLEDKDV